MGGKGKLTDTFGRSGCPGHRPVTVFLLPLLLAALLPFAALADSSIKKRVFDDCQSALTEAPTLAQSEQDDLVGYLARVLRIQGHSMTEMLADQLADAALGSKGTPLEEWTSQSLHTGDPKQLARAKECSVKLLLTLSPRSISAVPEMLMVQQDPTVAEPLREIVADALWQIVVKVSGQEPNVIDPQIIRRIVELQGSYLSENVLVELHRQSIPVLIEELKNPSSSRRERILRILLRSDVVGNEVGPQLLPLIESGDESLRLFVIQVLAHLPHAATDSLAKVIQRLNDTSPSVRAAAVATIKALTSNLEQSQQVPEIDTQGATSILHFITTASPDELEVLGRVIGRSTGAALILEKLTPLLKSDDHKLRATAVSIYGYLSAKEPVAFDRVIQALYDPTLVVSLRAIDALPLSSNRELALSALAKLLKATKSLSDRSLRDAKFQAAAKVLRRFPASDRSLVPFVPYMIEGLVRPSFVISEQEDSQDGIDNSAVQALAHIGADSLPQVVKLLRDKDQTVQHRALKVIETVREIDPRYSRELVARIGDFSPQLHPQLLATLIAVRPSPIAELLKLLKSKGSVRNLAAKALVALGENNPTAFRIVEQQFTEAPCTARVDYVTATGARGEKLKQLLVEKLLECLQEQGGSNERVLAALESLGPLAPPCIEKLADLLSGAVTSGGKAFDPRSKFQILDKLSLTRISNHRLEEVLRELLGSGDISAKARTIELLGQLESIQIESVTVLRQIAEQDGSNGAPAEPLIRGEAFVALTRAGQIGTGTSAGKEADPLLSAMQRYFENELKSDRSAWAKEAVLRLPASISFPLLTQALAESDSSQATPIVEVLTELNFNAGRRDGTTEDLVPKELEAVRVNLVTLLEQLVATARHNLQAQAVIALARFAPEHPEITEGIRKALIGRSREKLLKRGIGRLAKRSIEEILARPQSYVEYQAALTAKNISG